MSVEFHSPINPHGPGFDDYPYPGPGDLEPLPDVFEPDDWRTPPVNQGSDRANILHALRELGGHATFEQLRARVGADAGDRLNETICDLVDEGAVALYGRPTPNHAERLVEHLYVLTDTGRQMLPQEPEQAPAVDRLDAFLGYVASLQRFHQREEPPDGSIILVDENAAYVRTDPPPGEPLRRLASGVEVGDWHPLNGDDTAEPTTLLEILGFDDPLCDRKPHSLEVLYTADDIARLATEVAAEFRPGATG
jgi:hypothetical protein